MSTQKECHIFDKPDADGFSIDGIHDQYAPYFREALHDQLWGEATPIYVYFPRIAEYLLHRPVEADVLERFLDCDS